MGYLLKRKVPAVRGGSDGKRKTRLSFAGLALLIVGAFAVSCGGTAAEQGAGPQDGGEEEQASVALDRPTLGDENAPVVLTEYADYQ